MLLFPAIDLYDGKAVRLIKGDYQQMTIYSDNPIEVANDFKNSGCNYVHIVDLQGAKDGSTFNFELICKIKQATGLFVEVGGGIRDLATIDKYLSNGIDRVILGTIAITDPDTVNKAIKKYGNRIALGLDVNNGEIAIKGWLENSHIRLDDYLKTVPEIENIIVTDISKDGLLKGTNYDLYAHLKATTKLKITASGGISNLDDLKRLAQLDIYGAIIGKAYYSKAIDLKTARKEIQ